MTNKLKIYQEKVRGCDDSFFYDGLIAKTDKGEMVAVGEIRIHDKENNLVHDGWKERNDGLTFKVKTDKDLVKIEGEDSQYHWENNNWFEVYETGNTEGEPFVSYSYSEALKVLKSI